MQEIINNLICLPSFVEIVDQDQPGLYAKYPVVDWSETTNFLCS